MQEREIERQITVGASLMPYEADIVRSLIEACDIPVCPADYYTIYIKWLYADALGGIKLRVSEQDAAEAREIIAGALGKRSNIPAKALHLMIGCKRPPMELP